MCVGLGCAGGDVCAVVEDAPCEEQREGEGAGIAASVPM